VSIPDNAIAVVGMAGKFPGANDLSAFWNNLQRGKESIVTLSEQELRDEGVSDKTLANPSYVRRAPLLDAIDEFDADFFGFAPLAAQVLDPQHRLFLQCAWHALEDAGCDPARYDGSIGVYGTSSPSGYLLHNLLSHRDPNAVLAEGLNFDQFSLFLQNDKDFLTTRVSHAFNLRGPSLAVQTACSSSLVAVHLACLSLLSGECDMALAGGSSLCIPHRVGYWNSPGSMVSAVGHCRPFDVRADGTVFGSGVGMVVLKPLQAAIDAGDRVHAVIRGSAINNDGSQKMGYAAPNPVAQADVIAEAHAVSGIDSSTVSYVECHGTATPLGDPIEIQGLRAAFEVSETPRAAPCVLGSVKSNIGHLEVAAGIAGLIKTILCLKNKALPATLHYTSPNPELHLDTSPFTVRNTLTPWEWDGPRRAGVSSFGVGGTNAHLVLEEAPEVPSHARPTGPQVLLLSAKTAAALEESRSTLATALAGPDAPGLADLADVAYTLAGRRKHNYTLAAVVHDHEQAATVLRAAEHDNIFEGEAVTEAASSDRVVFLSPGQGAQHVDMAKGLYDSEPVFAEHFDACAAGFREETGIDVHAEIFGGSATTLEHIDRAHPALFAVGYALAKLAESYGIRAGAYAGHSIGEYIAATLAGVFDLETAIKVVSKRAELLHASPAGAMVAVALGPDAVAEHLMPGVDIAVVNDPASCVVAGADEPIRAFIQRLGEHGILARRVRVSHAAHSSSMDAVVPEFQDFLSRVQLREPHTPLLSNVTGTWMSAEEATDPARWARQIRATVRFSDELEAMLADPHRILVELGPGGSLTGSAVRHPKWSTGHRAVRLMRHPVQSIDDRDAFLLALGQLWSAGVAVDWSPLTGVSADAQPQLVSLPGYPFARQRHWVEPAATVRTVTTDASLPVANGATNGAAVHRGPGTGAGSGTEETLHRIWSQCLGLNSIDRKDNFFELGGDSLIAVGIATNAATEGLEITPRDLYEHPTLAGLAAAIDAQYAAGGLTKPPDETAHPAVPPTIAHFLEHGVRETGSWRIPLIVRLDPKVSADDVRAVLAAVIDHHDALRLRLVERAGAWEQHIAAPERSDTFDQLLLRTLPDGVEPATPAAREAVLDILAELASGQQAADPLTAAYVTAAGSGSGPRYLALSVHEMVADDTSREILATDLFTAFTQRLAGNEIVLPPTHATWREWSLRCASLATHPAVLDSSDFWRDSARATMRLADPEITSQPDRGDLTRLPSALTSDQTAQLDDARRRLTASLEEILLAALSRAVAQAVGEGTLTVDLEGTGRSVLRPDVDLRRTIGRFSTLYPAPLPCMRDNDSTELLASVRETLRSVPHYGIGYGLLRHVYAPTARLLAAEGPADIHFRYAGVIPEVPPLDAPVQFDSDAAMPVREPIPGLGHAIELRVYRHSGVLHLDWWYDARRIQGARAQALAQRFPMALRVLIEDAIEAMPEDDSFGSESVELALVDLSTLDAG
jgi:phthiocerol/phenolphthiocerol synthesis type-I polyketide synthase E